ncbi:hypothetical protein [Kurthia huakuii]|uniref:hypothetical protein n=1 Tax=Kurthia huakuii TaxID=1421019 RepID=UPI00049561A6|nr:hypothetical protein [Kurthia huakuii]MBM7699375.1 hypothetical protein [Kurthia huakuii]
MPEIQLPTATKQETILTNVNSNKATLSTINTNLGTPTSTASSAISANAHAKLNALLVSTSTIADDAFGSNMFNSVVSLSDLTQITSEANGTATTILTGKMLLKNVVLKLYGNSTSATSYSTVNIDGKIYKPTKNGSLLTFNFSELYINSLLRVKPTSNYNFDGIGLTYGEMHLFP